jgi:predicted RNase H-like nuclease (RuvC/YqgF family)
VLVIKMPENPSGKQEKGEGIKHVEKIKIYQDQIKKLEEEIQSLEAKIQSIQGEVEESESRIKDSSERFENAYISINDQITKDIEIYNQIL